jgi:asparagine synthase (glutamine-hydrolysing)
VALTYVERQFSLHHLALCFSPASIVGEFNPVSPWVDGAPPPRRTSRPATDRASRQDGVNAAFRKGIEECIGDAQTVAVSCSGGLDSAAVLYNAAAVCGADRRLVAITADLRSDRGESCAALAEPLIRALGTRCDWRVVTATPDAVPRPLWHPAGPRLDAMPGLNRAIAEVAEQEGAGVLLTGTGADELLGTPRYVFGRMLRARCPSVWRYLGDLATGGAGRLALELGAVSARLLPRRLAVQLYWAANWPELCCPAAPSVLREAHRARATEWTRAWLRQSLLTHAGVWGGWAAADARDSLFPYEPLAPSTSLPKRSPFIESSFFDWALGVALPERYNGREQTPYQRRKALVLRLLPEAARGALPLEKATFAIAFEKYQWHTFSGAARLIEHGIVVAPLPEDQVDSTMLHRLQAVDDWVRGAEVAGGQPSEG